MVAFVLSLISIVLMFLNEILGLIFAIIALVIGIVGMKKQEKWTKTAVIISIVSIIIFAGILFFDLVKIGRAQQQINQIHDEVLEEYNKEQEQWEQDYKEYYEKN